MGIHTKRWSKGHSWGKGKMVRVAGIVSLPKLFARLPGIVEQFRRWKRGCLWILVGLVFLCLALCALAIFFAGRSSAQGAATRPLDAILLIDHSNSMWDKGGIGSDPGMLRVEAANLFIAYLGVDTDRPGNRLGIVHFGGHSELVVPLTSLDSAEQRQAIRAAIANPQRMAWTDPLEALQLAYDVLFPAGRPDLERQAVVILLSDGKPELGPSTATQERENYLAQLRALVERFRDTGCPIFTIALSNEATDADPEIQTVYRNLWQEIAATTPPAEYHEARTAADLPRVYHAIVAKLMGARAGAPVVETTVDGGSVQTIAVEPGLARLTLVVLRSDPALEVRLLRPGGAPARPDDPDVQRAGEPGATREEVWAITDPRPGHWSLDLQGHGVVTVWRDTVPAAAVEPSAYAIEVPPLPVPVTAGQSLEVVGISVREVSAGEMVVDPGLQIVVELRRAGFVEATFLARDDGQGCDGGDHVADDGRYCVAISAPPAGVSTLHLRALRQGVEIARHEVIFEGLPPPEPVEIVPSPDALSPVSLAGVEARTEGPKTVPPAEAARSATSPLHWIVPLAGLAVLGSAGGGLLIWQRRRRVILDGILRVLGAPPSAPSSVKEGTTIDLPALPSFVLGGTKASKGVLPLPGGAPCVTLRAERAPEGDVETWIAPPAERGDGAIALNNRGLETARRLNDGDVLTLGDYRLRYESVRQASARRARHRPRRAIDWIGGTR